jgi:hypothetical protein
VDNDSGSANSNDHGFVARPLSTLLPIRTHGQHFVVDVDGCREHGSIKQPQWPFLLIVLIGYTNVWLRVIRNVCLFSNPQYTTRHTILTAHLKNVLSILLHRLRLLYIMPNPKTFPNEERWMRDYATKHYPSNYKDKKSHVTKFKNDFLSEFYKRYPFSPTAKAPTKNDRTAVQYNLRCKCIKTNVIYKATQNVVKKQSPRY